MELECNAGVSKLSIKAKEEDGIVTRTVRITLVREFDEVIAGALGGDAQSFLDSLRDGGVAKVVIPIDAVVGELDLDGERGESVTIKMVQGVKAIGSAPKKEDEDPTIELVFDFPFGIKAWDFFGQNVGARASLRFSESQLELPGTAKPANGEAKHSARQKLQEATDSLAKSTGADVTVKVLGSSGEVIARADAAPDDEDPQEAPTPEEAESIRERRLADERAAEMASAFCLKRYEEVEPEIAVDEKDGVWLASLETETASIEALGDDEPAARAALRVKLLVKFAEEEAKLAGAGAAPKNGLKPPKGKHGRKKHDDGPPPDEAPEPETKPDDDGLAF